MSRPDIDSLALRLANIIEQIYQSDLPGGDCQKKARVQCLLAEILQPPAKWQQRYREITGEAE